MSTRTPYEWNDQEIAIWDHGVRLGIIPPGEKRSRYCYGRRDDSHGGTVWQFVRADIREWWRYPTYDVMEDQE